MIRSIALILLATALLTACLAGTTRSSAQDVTAFVNVNVVPMDEERILENQTVLVRGDRIVAVGPAAEIDVPAGALRIDGTGKYLMPGLAEMHGHIPSPTTSEQYVEDVLFLFVANGITTVRGMQGAPGQLALRERAARGEIVSPTLYLAGPGFSGGSISSPEQAAERVRQQKEEGWDLLKVLPGLTREEYDAMARTAREVGIDFGGHVPAEVGLAHAIDMGQRTYDHLDGYIEHLDGSAGPVDQNQLEDIVRRTREAGQAVVPTMALWEVLMGTLDLEAVTSLPELAYVPPDMASSWTRTHEQRLSGSNFNPERAHTIIDNRMRVLRALNEGGVTVLMGTDAPQQFSVPGFSHHHELVRMADAGMTPYEILRSGTTNIGEYFADQDYFGTVSEGARADLILVNSDPLQDATQVAHRSGVMVRGQWLSEEQIQARLDAIAERHR